MMNIKKCALHTAVMLACGLGTQLANAGATISFGEDKYISAGFGFISSYNSVEDASNGGKDRSNDFTLDSARLYLSGSFNKYIKGMLNTEKSGGGSANSNFEVIDANVQFQVTPEVAIWAGRFLSPSDRANMAGPYYSMGGGYWANIASRYGWNGGVIGRDDGVAVVSSFLEDHLAVSFGAFEGNQIFRFSGVGAQSQSSTTKDNLMYAGRVQYNFWDAEPGYYGTGNYFGAKDILSIGIAGRMKKDGAVAPAVSGVAGDYKSYSVDFLLEKKDVGPGTFSAEAAYYYYDTDNVFLGEQGKAYSAGLGYLFSEPVGWGKIMPIVRYQKFDADGVTSFDGSTSPATFTNNRGSNDTKRFEIGANYIIAPYNSVITATVGKTDTSATSSDNFVKVALQMQF
ncbi:porin [Methylophilus medardicus]|uniref:Porin n=1 Tax=Methylophilus medardicus TaxID=2588534 RepID=A0A5B8CRB3_9PROT|nr:porin [Methylophilus medardicus]QDC43630.1 porin [Methylophilus medardicus]QDC48637.1 porin [Methylophilus medardicus]QDC52342.1 porin [Methylophilus medardicus]